MLWLSATHGCSQQKHRFLAHVFICKTRKNCVIYITSLLIREYREYFPGVKRPSRKENHSPPSIAEVKKKWSCTSAPSIRLHVVKGKYLILRFTLFLRTSHFQTSATARNTRSYAFHKNACRNLPHTILTLLIGRF